MAQKSVQNSKKTNITNPINIQIPKKGKFVKVILIIIGIILGWSVNVIFQNKHEINNSLSFYKEDQKTKKHKSRKIKLSEYKFVNPFVLTPVYNKMYILELANFKIQVENYCIKAEKEKSIEAISVYFRDLTNDYWFGVNEKEKFMPASLVKVPILIATLLKAESDPDYFNKKLIYKGSFTDSFLKEHIEIDDIRTPMIVNESYTVDKLLDLMITKSDNESAFLLYDDIGIKRWNAFENLLGNKVPIAAPDNKNIITTKNYSSFFRILYNASLLNREYSEKALEILSRSEYNKGIRLAVPLDILVCHKYGERDSAISPNEIVIRQLHHAGIVYYPGKPFFICVMIKGSDKIKMQNIIYDISKLIYKEVDKQVKLKPKIDKDIN